MSATAIANGPKASTPQSKSNIRSKKSRIARRRGRARTDSDDEIEREARSDSDTEDQSSLASDSDSESASDDEHHPGIVTPSTTQSPPPLDINGSSSAVKPEALVNGSSGPFVGPTDWAQIVADENANGGGDLPVIDFAEMHTHSITETAAPRSRSRKQSKQAKKAAAPRATQESSPPAAPKLSAQPPNEEAPAVPADEPVASTSRNASKEPPASRSRGQSARQAYQERLQADPAFVPKVGEFWGHDDRLLEKEYRSLSGWWRGRWHTRGRGRGGFSMRGRGGHGAVPARWPTQEEAEGGDVASVPSEEVPPIERAWTHDGFEEMKRREDQRKDDHRRAQTQAQPSPPPSRGTPARGRGVFLARGRGGAPRGGHATTPTKGEGATQANPHNDFSSKRPWFAMKPEKAWTKHTDGFLYVEGAPRPRFQGAGVRIKLPGKTAQVIHSKALPNKAIPSAERDINPPPSVFSDEGDRQFSVKLPRPSTGNQGSASTSVDVPPASAVDTDLSIEEVFTVRPHAVPAYIPIGTHRSSASVALKPSEAAPVTISASAQVSTSPPVSSYPDPDTQRQLEEVGIGISTSADSDAAPSAVIQETLLRNPSQPEVVAPVPQVPLEQSRAGPPALHPLQTSFSPAPQASPPYGSPYAYGPTLPPGVALNHQGYPYEIATGRAVFLQPTPPPTMYTPRPMMHGYVNHGMTFVPGHMHHPSQEYVPHVHSPPVNGFVDPATGVPIFAPARQNSRIEIRAPSDRADGKALKPAPRPSGLRTSSSEVDSSKTAPEEPDSTSAPQSPPQPPSQVAVDPAIMAYAYPPQPYYYPDPNGYSAYMDMSPPPIVQYDLYPPPDQRAHQPMAYY